jgi:hypothetical protein
MAVAKEHIPRGRLVRSKRRKAPLLADKKLQRLQERVKELEGLRETALLLGSPENAARLRSALAQAKAGKLIERELDE